MRRRMARAGVTIAAVASLGLGGGLAVAAASPAGASQAAASSGGLQSIEGLLGQVESVVCLVLDIATGQTPPYGPPGDVCAGR
jgi:hypothetical protein